jgi:HlyD family secretion protein
MRKWILIGAVGAAAIAAVLVVPNLLAGQQGAASAQDIETAVVERATINETVESSGSVNAERTIYLTFGTSGQVSEVLVSVGDPVEAGQVLARLDTETLAYQIRLQELSLAQQQATYDQFIEEPTASEIAQAQSSIASAQSQVLQAQANLDAAPNSITLNCTDVADRESDLADAQRAWADYVNDGYRMDATFVPDPDSEAGAALASAQTALTRAQAQCDNTTTISELETQLASAQASLAQAQASYDALIEGPTAAEIASQQARLEQSMMELENARDALEDAEITAPFSGTIGAVNITVGEMVNSSLAAITLVDNSVLHVTVPVDELDIPAVLVGQDALVSPEALEDTVVTGRVTLISPVADTSDGSVTYDVRIDFADIASLPLYVGMTTDVEIILASQPDVLVVPTDAIQRLGANEFVEVLQSDGTRNNVPVTTGTTLDGLTVVEGVDEGAEVVIPAEEASAAGGFPGPFGG